MAHYLMLATYTAQGVSAIQDTVKRVQSVKALAKKAGVVMTETYWTLGPVDVAAIFEAPDDETMTAFSLSIAKLGNVRTQTLRAFTAEEMRKVLEKLV